MIQSVQVTRRGRVRRAKLYYLRDRVGKRTKLRAVLGKRGLLPEAPVVEAPSVPVEETAEA